MSSTQARCLILACGNTMRSDDGVGLWLAEWAERRFKDQPGVRVLADHQWTPELAEDVACAESVLFIDCSLATAPGSVHLSSVEPAAAGQGINTHHQNASELLALARDLYHSQPQSAQLLTIGAANLELGETFSSEITAAIPAARIALQDAVRAALA